MRIEPLTEDRPAYERWARVVRAAQPWGSPDAATLAFDRRGNAARVDVLATANDVDLGAASFHPEGASAIIGTWVRPEARARGVGDALLARVVQLARESGVVTLTVEVQDDDPQALRFALHRDFVEVERNREMVLDLEGRRPPPCDPPAGIVISTRAHHDSDDCVNQMFAVACEAVPDIPGVEGNETLDFDRWRRAEIEHPHRPARLCFVAFEGAVLQGYGLLHEGAHRVAFHGLTGVRRAARRRGIASAIKRAQIGAAIVEGYRSLVTESVAANVAIQILNERSGYRDRPGSIVLVRELG